MVSNICTINDFVLPLQNQIKEQMKKKRITIEKKSTVTDKITGEVLMERTEESFFSEIEPDFIKMYTIDLLLLLEVPPDSLRIMIIILRQMSYTNILYTDKDFVETCINYIGISERNIRRSISILCSKGVLLKIQKGKYIVNPELFARGSWKDIKKIKLSISYSNEGVKIESDLVPQMIENKLIK